MREYRFFSWLTLEELYGTYTSIRLQLLGRMKQRIRNALWKTYEESTPPSIHVYMDYERDALVLSTFALILNKTEAEALLTFMRRMYDTQGNYAYSEMDALSAVELWKALKPTQEAWSMGGPPEGAYVVEVDWEDDEGLLDAIAEVSGRPRGTWEDLTYG